MKKYNNVLNTENGNIYVFATLLLCLFFLIVAILFSKNIFAVNSEPTEIVKREFVENKNPINLEQIIEDNFSEEVTEKIVVEEVDLEYTTRYKNNDELASGTVQVLQEGRAGKQSFTIKQKFIGEELISEEKVAENIVKAPVERIVEVGTNKQYKNYKVKKGDTVYVVATSVAVRLAPEEAAEKICTLNKNDEARILEIVGDWYFISTVEIKGYVPSNCVTSINPKQELSSDFGQVKAGRPANLSFGMDLRKPSGLSLEQFKKVLSGDKNDKNNVFGQIAEYFYYAEKQYGINGIFVASVAIHESGWGASAISKNKKNLFGYGAVDSNPYGGAYDFTTYADGIDLLARVFAKYYLNPPGTKIYDGTEASGKFYNGTTLSAVNMKYASDKNWANSVYKWMKYLYNKI